MSLTPQRILRAAAWVALLACGTVHAGLYPAYPTGTGPGVWEVDRYPPAGFVNAGAQSGRANVLALTLSSGDSAANRPPAYASTFYNTQGRGIQEDLAAGRRTSRAQAKCPTAIGGGDQQATINTAYGEPLRAALVVGVVLLARRRRGTVQ